MYKYAKLPDQLSVLDAADYWRSDACKDGFPYEDPAFLELLNRQVLEEYDDLYLYGHFSPEGRQEWESQMGLPWNAPGPTAEDWAVRQTEYYEAVYDIDHFSAVGRGGPPVITGHVIRSDVRRSLPGYSDFEAGKDREREVREEERFSSRLFGLDLRRRGASASAPEAERTKVLAAAKSRSRAEQLRDIPDFNVLPDDGYVLKQPGE